MRIGLIGFAGSGKDTAGKFLQEFFLEKGIDLAIHKFATPLKEITAKIFGENFDAKDTKEKEVDFLQDKKEKIYSEVSILLDTMSLSSEDKDNFIGYMFDNLLQFSDKCSPRKFQQVLGAAGRFIDKDFWVKAQDGKQGIFTDVRFGNEADTMDKLVYIFEPTIHETMFTAYTLGILDKSEHFAATIDKYADHKVYCIYNNSSLDKLRENCKEYLNTEFNSD